MHGQSIVNVAAIFSHIYFSFFHSPTPSLKSKQTKPSVDDLVNDVACGGLQTPTATVLPSIGGTGVTLGGVSSSISAPVTRPVSSTRDEGMLPRKHINYVNLFTLFSLRSRRTSGDSVHCH